MPRFLKISLFCKSACSLTLVTCRPGGGFSCALFWLRRQCRIELELEKQQGLPQASQAHAQCGLRRIPHNLATRSKSLAASWHARIYEVFIYHFYYLLLNIILNAFKRNLTEHVEFPKMPYLTNKLCTVYHEDNITKNEQSWEHAEEK